MLYMPPRCWHQVEYPECSVALTYAFYRSKSMQFVGTLVGRFWLGFMSYTQAFTARKLVAFATLPLLLPLAIFCVVYVAAMFFAHKCLGRASFLVRLPCQAAESLMFLLYWPLMYCFLRKMWVGY